MFNWILELMPLFIVRYLVKGRFERLPIDQWDITVINPRQGIFIEVKEGES